MTWRGFFLGLVGAAINSAATAVTVMIVDPTEFNLFQGGAAKLGAVVLVSGMLGAALYLKTHRLPGAEQ
jgi:hypothetical protein